jgi:methylthioribose-1-phosphate isomerase
LEERWLVCADLETVAVAIETMVVRGAPAIGCTAAFGLAIHARNAQFQYWKDFRINFYAGYDRLQRTRPTAVNLFYALKKMSAEAELFDDALSKDECVRRLETVAVALFDDDINTCRQIGQHGLSLWSESRKLRVLTHCNTGSLATAGYGTALGIIRSLHQAGALEAVYVDETRPYMQGTRLTSYELKADGIPFELICDSSAAYLMSQGKVDWVVVGADRIAANGDTANKIGTYSLAVNCQYHNVAFYVAAPLATFDPSTASGKDIPVEMRTPDEITKLFGQQVAPSGIACLNPSFDVTPASLITGIVTELGVLRPPFTDSIAAALNVQRAEGGFCP